MYIMYIHVEKNMYVYSLYMCRDVCMCVCSAAITGLKTTYTPDVRPHNTPFVTELPITLDMHRVCILWEGLHVHGLHDYMYVHGRLTWGHDMYPPLSNSLVCGHAHVHATPSCAYSYLPVFAGVF